MAYIKGFSISLTSSCKKTSIDALKEGLQKIKEQSFTLPFGDFFYRAKLESRTIVYSLLVAIILVEGLYMAVAAQDFTRNEPHRIPASPMQAVSVVAPKKIILIDENIATSHLSFAKTPREFLQNKNIIIGQDDLLVPDIDSTLYGFSPSIFIRRAKQVTIVDNNHEFKVTGVFNTVGDIFKESAIYSNALTERGVDLSAKIEDGSRVILDTKVTQRGIASWYGPGFHGRITASGEVYDMHGVTAAHKTLPLGTTVRVVNVRNGRWVVLNINDRGPYVGARMLDLSLGAKQKLGAGDLSYVWVEVLKYPEKFVYGADTSLDEVIR